MSACCAGKQTRGSVTIDPGVLLQLLKARKHCTSCALLNPSSGSNEGTQPARGHAAEGLDDAFSLWQTSRSRAGVLQSAA